MDTTSSINDRKWRIVELSADELRAIPRTEKPSIPDVFVCGSDSQAAKYLEKKGVEPFYYDYQQLEAGLDKVYGLSRVSDFAEDYEFADGSKAKAGALLMELSKFDMETYLFTVLVEEI